MCGKYSLLFLLAAACAWPQSQPVELVAITPDTVIATVNGQKFTAGEFEQITQNISPEMRRLAGTDPQKFLEQYALTAALRAEAERAGLTSKSPYKEQIESALRDILASAIVAEKGKEGAPPDEELRKIYDGKRSEYSEAVVKVIFVSRLKFERDMATGKQKSNTGPAQAKQKALEVAQMARAGKDFVALAKQYSDDRTTAEKGADFPYPIRSGSTNIPLEIRNAVFKAKQGDIVGPLEHDSGFYLFRVESKSILPFESVKEDISKQLRAEAVDKWLAEMKKRSTVSLDHKAFWDTFLAANKAANKNEGAK
jgi:parvulin-like peptidyl-prolyl isomerase